MLGENFTAALGNAPSGMNTLKAFITRFMATKGFHSWLSFFSGEAGTGFDYALSSVFTAEKSS